MDNLYAKGAIEALQKKQDLYLKRAVGIELTPEEIEKLERWDAAAEKRAQEERDWEAEHRCKHCDGTGYI